jgi:hypothetical protein
VEPLIPQHVYEKVVERDSRPFARILWGLLRAFVVIFGLIITLGGVGFLYAFFQGESWWTLVIGVLLSIGGAWFLWGSIFGKRRMVDEIVTHFLFNLLDHLF